MQTTKSRSKVPDTHDLMDVVKKSYLLEKSDTKLVIYVKMDSSNYTYAESFRTHMYWEVYQPEPGSTKSVLRNSWKFTWKDKPMMKKI